MGFTKILVSKNEGKINSEINQTAPHKKYFQDIIDKLIEIGIQPKEKDLNILFENPKAYITEKLTDGKSFDIGGLLINKEKLFELIEKPTGTDELIKKIELDLLDRTKLEFFIWKVNNFVVVENKVTLAPDFIELINTNASIFIENENQKIGFEKLQTIAKLFNEINQLDGKKITLNTEFDDIFQLSNGKLEPKPQIFKYLFY